MFVQQRMTPSTADPAQQKMMMFMPLMFTVMFLWAPSGLVLYWSVSNLWAIGQQVLTNRLIGPPTQRSVRPPAERQLKSAGGGQDRPAAKERTSDGTDWACTGGTRVSSNRQLGAMGVPLDVAIEDSPDSVRDQPRGRGWRRAAAAPRARRSTRCSTSSTPPSGASSTTTDARRRLHGLPQGQGRRAAADGAFLRRRPRTRGAPQEIGPAEPLRAPHRAPGGRDDPQ